MSGRLDGKVAVITGAASGMGRAAAVLFAAEGARVALLDIDEAAVQGVAEGIGATALPVRCDITSEEDVKSAVHAVIEHLGPMTVLYNNAGIDLGGPSGDGLTGDVSTDVLDATLAVNLRGMFSLTRETLPHLVEAGGGSIINTSSVSGALIGSSQHAYAVSKAGVVGLTRSLALGYAKHGVRANCICPGIIRTPLIDFILEDEAQATKYIAGTPLGRVAEPEDIAPLALYLASDESSFMTGAVIPIDGGLTAH